MRAARVMVLVDTLAAGGAERLAVELACALDRDAFAPHLVATKRGGPLEERLAVAGVPYRVLGRRGRSSPRAAAAALGLARASDLIHSHLFGNNVWGALLARAAGVPLVAHEHNRAWRQTAFERMLDRALVGRAATRVVCVSTDAARPLLDAGVDPAKLELVPNGIALGAALSRDEARRALGLPAAVPVVGAVASLRPEKALDVLVRAFGRLAARRPELVLCLVGDGTERDRLRTLAQGLRVVFAGERTDAPRLASAFDVAVLCSRSEGLPLSALEALAAGTPLVGTRVGALPDLLSGGAGVLVEPGDDAELAAAIGNLLDDPVRAAAAGRVGREVVAARYRLDTAVGRVERIYREALAAGRRGAEFTAPEGAEEEGSVASVASRG
jgi:glycosyltransferase involved in cell wall biosynthesis